MIESLIKLLNSLKFLNWARVAELSVLIVVLVAALTFYENRQRVYESIGAKSLSDTAAVVVSPQMQEEMNQIVSRSSVILGLHVAEVNFIKNERTSIFFATDDKAMKEGYDRYMKTRIIGAPVFSTKEFENNRIVRLVNGEFVCLPFNETIGPNIFGPDAGANVGQVCSIALPPIYGKFRGYVTAYVSKDIKPAELGSVRVMLQNISLGVYNGK